MYKYRRVQNYRNCTKLIQLCGMLSCRCGTFRKFSLRKFYDFGLRNTEIESNDKKCCWLKNGLKF